MKDIDFLPVDYRQRTARRRGSAGRLITACALLAIVAGVDVWQRATRHAAESELARLERPFLDAQQLKAHLAELQQTIDQAEEEARVLAFLDHRWPVTQLIAVPTAHSTESIQLLSVELQLSSARDGGVSRNTLGADVAAESAAEIQVSPHVQTLAELRELAGGESLIVTGNTTDPQAAQAYVNQLTRSPLVDSAKLQSVASVRTTKLDIEQKEESRFVVHVKIIDSLEVANQHIADTAQIDTSATSLGGASL